MLSARGVSASALPWQRGDSSEIGGLSHQPPPPEPLPLRAQRGQQCMAEPEQRPERRISALSARLSGSSDEGSAEPAGCAEALAAAARAQADAYRIVSNVAPAGADDTAALARTASLPNVAAGSAPGPSPPSALRRQMSVPASPVGQLRASLGHDRCQHGSSAALAHLMGSSAGSEDGASPLHDAPNAPPGDAPEARSRGRRCVNAARAAPRRLAGSLTLPRVGLAHLCPTALCFALRPQRHACWRPTRARGLAARRETSPRRSEPLPKLTALTLLSAFRPLRRHIRFADEAEKPTAEPSSPSPTSPLEWNALPRRST